MPINAHIIQVISFRNNFIKVLIAKQRKKNLLNLEKSLNDFELVPNQRLQIKPKSILIGLSVESCSEK